MSKDTVKIPDPCELTDDELDAVAGGTFDRPGAGDIRPQKADTSKTSAAFDPDAVRDFGLGRPLG